MQKIHKCKNLQVYKTTFKGSLSDLTNSLAKEQPFVLLDSASSLSAINQWSFLATEPLEVFRFKDGDKNSFDLLRDFFNDGVQEEWREINFSPYIGGPVGYISYDAARYIEKLPSQAYDDLKLPDFYFIKPGKVFAHNLQTNDLFIYQYSTDCHPEERSAGACLPQAGISIPIDNLFRDSSHSLGMTKNRFVNSFKSNISKTEFESAVKKIREFIYAGDVYQVNFSQRFESDFSSNDTDLYNHLKEINPSPFCSLLKAEDFSLISSSPERLAFIDANGFAQTRPIAGTRRRGSNQNEDDFLTGNLLLDEKERAEHIMLVDLERNDLGKVCEYESIKVDELMTIEKYSHVIHIVSNVVGRLHKDKDAFDLIKAMFPGGTITGCPKVRCMEIIEQLEPTRRGPYTGSLGYFSYNGSIDFNILIRTIVHTAGKVFLQAGAGIVADSKPEREYFETISKAQALFKSLGADYKEKQWEVMST